MISSIERWNVKNNTVYFLECSDVKNALLNGMVRCKE
jgi:hypothetical protein